MREPHESKLLLRQACVKFFSGVLLVMLLLFVPAGTLGFSQGWLFMGVLFVPMFLAGLIMWKKAPDLLKRRLKAKETEGEQKTVIAFSGMMFLAGFILCGLRVRFAWRALPLWASLVAAVVFLAGYAMFGVVLRQNAYLSRTIEVQEGQKVVDTGLYGIVRHPMYAVTLALFLSMPLILGSLVSLLVFLAYPFIIAARIKNEEAVLTEGLEGYAEYKKKVKYRLIPFIW